MDSNRTTADLGTVQHHVVGTRQCSARIRSQYFRIINAWRREWMVQRCPALAGGVFLEHREIDNPQRCPAISNQTAVFANFDAECTQCVIDHPCLIGTKEDQIT